MADKCTNPGQSRLELRYRAPGSVDGYEVHELGEKKPPYVIVLKGVHGSAAITAVVRALGEAHGKRLAGSPIVVLPEGAEFELWEVVS